MIPFKLEAAPSFVSFSFRLAIIVVRRTYGYPELKFDTSVANIDLRCTLVYYTYRRTIIIFSLSYFWVLLENADV